MAKGEGAVGSAFWREDVQRWVYSFPDDSSKTGWRQHRLPHGIVSKAHAELAGRTWLAEQVAKGRILGKTRQGESSTIEALSHRWIESRKADRYLKPSTKRDDGVIFRNAVNPHIGKFQIDIITILDIRHWLLELKDRLSPGRVRGTHLRFGLFFQWCIDENKTTYRTNPCYAKAVVSALPKETKPFVDHLTLDEFARVVNNPKLPARWCLRFLIGAYAGLRDGEIAALTFDHARMDDEIPFFRVENSFSWVGREYSATGFELSGPKTEDSFRRVPIHPTLHAMLRWWRSEGWEIEYGKVPESSSPILPTIDPDRHARPASAKCFRRYLRHAGLSDRSPKGDLRRFHLTRACFTTWLDELGVSDGTVERLVGHAPKTVKNRHYTATVLQKLQGAILEIPSHKIHCAGYCADAQTTFQESHETSSQTPADATLYLRRGTSPNESTETCFDTNVDVSSAIVASGACVPSVSEGERTTKTPPAQRPHKTIRGVSIATFAGQRWSTALPQLPGKANVIELLIGHPLEPVARALAAMRVC